MTGTPESIQKVEDLDDLIRRDRSIGMTIFEMRRYVRELDSELPRPKGRGFLLHPPSHRERVHRLFGAFRA